MEKNNFLLNEENLEFIIDNLDDSDLNNLNVHNTLLNRIFKENNHGALEQLFHKNDTVFSFIAEEKRVEIIDLYSRNFSVIPLKSLVELCENTLFGNLIFINILHINNPIISIDNLDSFFNITYLDFVNEDIMLDYLPISIIFSLNIDKRISDEKNKINIELLINFIENLFFSDHINTSKNTIESMINLYNVSREKRNFIKKDILYSLIIDDKEMFFKLINIYSEFKLETIQNFIDNYTNIFLFLISRKIPIYYDYDQLKINDSIINNNCYYMLYINESGIKSLLNPFGTIKNKNIQIYDMNTKEFFKPYSYQRNLRLEEIYSFNKINNIKTVDDLTLDKVKKLSEDEIEYKIEEILHDSNKTSHSPVEKIDIWTLKILIFNEEDIRTGGFIIKGKGFKKITLETIAVNLLKAIDIPIDLLFLIYTGVITDETKDHFIKQCINNNKFYSLVDCYDLSRLFKAYNKI